MEIASSSIRTAAAPFTKNGQKYAANSPKSDLDPASAPTNQKVDIFRTETWVRYKPSLCKGCFAGCCTLPVQVTTEDLFHMGFLEVSEVNGPLLPIFKRLFQKGIVESFKNRSGTFTLKQKNGSDCIFLDKNRLCTIYERRPSICRRFPQNSARPGFCPGRKK